MKITALPARPALQWAALAALALAGAAAQAGSVTCQSRNNHREDCWLRGRGEVVLVRQISNTRCVKGRNWDETRNGIYVTDGCGGVFETRGGGGGWDDRPDRPDRPHHGRPDMLPPPVASGDERLPPPGAVAACVRAINRGRNVDVEQEARLPSGIWRYVLRYPHGRVMCAVNRQGQVVQTGRVD